MKWPRWIGGSPAKPERNFAAELQLALDTWDAHCDQPVGVILVTKEFLAGFARELVRGRQFVPTAIDYSGIPLVVDLRFRFVQDPVCVSKTAAPLVKAVDNPLKDVPL